MVTITPIPQYGAMKTPHALPTVISAKDAPHSPEAEEAVIGAVMIDPALYRRVREFLSEDDFYILRHRYVWQAIERLSQRNDAVDNLTITDELRRMGKLQDIGGPGHITHLTNCAPSSMHGEVYARLIQRAGFRRKLLSVKDEIEQLARDEDQDVDAIAQTVETKLFRVTAPVLIGKHEKSMAEAVEAYKQTLIANAQMEDGILGIPSGLTALDEELRGFQKGLTYVFAGVPKMGKTDLLMNFAWNAARLKQRVLFFSIEIRRQRIIHKLTSLISDIPHPRLLTGRLTTAEWQRVSEVALPQIAEGALEIMDFRDKTVSYDHLRQLAEVWRDQRGLDMIVIDYVSLINSGGKFRPDTYSEGTYGMTMLPRLAEEFNVPVLAAGQMRQDDIARRKNKRPQEEDLFMKTGRTYDVLVGLYYDRFYNPEAPPKEYELIPLLTRDSVGRTGGSGGIIKVLRDGSRAKFADLPDTEPLTPSAYKDSEIAF